MNLEVVQVEREYDLNRAAELKYGTSLELNKQLKVGWVVSRCHSRLCTMVPHINHSYKGRECENVV